MAKATATPPANRRIIRPQAGPQEAFLATFADLAIYGGGAGGGKTFATLLDPMRHVANPRFGAVIFRRQTPQITNEGGLWDESGGLYPLAGATPMVGSLDWRFPSGANVGMRHLQHEATKYAWQGTQVCGLYFDELTHFSESQFWYMLSRNRSTCGVRPYVRATCNPDASSWVKRLIAPWVDRKSPDPARSGELRWFVRAQGKMAWARDPDALKAEHPNLAPKSITFIRASIFDNPALLAKDPDYLGNLQAQDPVERARLLDGDWDVVNDGLVYPEFGTAVVEVEGWPGAIAGTPCGGIDWGWHNPFGALRGTLDRDDVLWVDWERHGSRITLTEHSKALPRGGIRWWGDPAGADQIAEMRQAGHDVVPCVHLGQQSVEAGIGMVTDRVRTGRLKVRGDLGHLIDEAGKYRRDDKGKLVDKDNHLLAALRYLVVGIDRAKSVKDAGPGRDEAAEEAARRAEQEARSAAWHDPHAEHWWGGDGDD